MSETAANELSEGQVPCLRGLYSTHQWRICPLTPQNWEQSIGLVIECLEKVSVFIAAFTQPPKKHSSEVLFTKALVKKPIIKGFYWHNLCHNNFGTQLFICWGFQQHKLERKRSQSDTGMATVKEEGPN